MGKRLTPEEREARIKAYNDLRAQKQAERLKKRKERAEAYEKLKAERQRKKEWNKRGPAPSESEPSGKVARVKAFPSYRGKVEVGDWVGFRWIGIAREGEVIKHTKEAHYRDESLPNDSEAKRFIELWHVRGKNEDTVYPISKENLLAKKVNGVWQDSCK